MLSDASRLRVRLLLIRHRKALILFAIAMAGLLAFALLINHLWAGFHQAPGETLLAIAYMLLVVFVVGYLEAD